MFIEPERLRIAVGEAVARVQWPRVALFCGLTIVIWWLVGHVKRRSVVTAGEARKINHIWTLAGGALWFGWLPEAQARSSMLTAAAILFALLAIACAFPAAGPLANVMHGYARESDGARRRFNVWSAWLLGLYGLGLIDGLCRDMVITRTAALVLGIGDGLGELIGTRFGRWTYPAPRLPGMAPSRRSVEGSLAVFVGTFVVTGLAFCVQVSFSDLISLAAAVAVATTLAEALSPHGTDNFTIPVAAGLAIHFHPAYASAAALA